MIEKLGYLISSHTGYEAPLQRLLMSMPPRVASRDVRVVVGGHAGRSTGHYVLVEQIYVPHNSYDYTALIDFVEHPENYPAWSHVFLLHDTMELGPNAEVIIRSADSTLYAVAPHGGECNLGLYRTDYVRACRAQLYGLKNCSKLYAVKMEGFLWRQLPDEQRGTYPGGIEISEPEQVYGGAARQRVYYAGVDIVKWKANWGQTWPPSVVTP